MIQSKPTKQNKEKCQKTISSIQNLLWAPYKTQSWQKVTNVTYLSTCLIYRFIKIQYVYEKKKLTEQWKGKSYGLNREIQTLNISILVTALWYETFFVSMCYLCLHFSFPIYFTTSILDHYVSDFRDNSTVYLKDYCIAIFFSIFFSKMKPAYFLF